MRIRPSRHRATTASASSSSARRAAGAVSSATTSRTNGSTRLLGDFLTSIISRERIDLVHGQHVMTSLPAIDAARRADVPVVCTVRDYWPVCYWSDLIYTNEGTGALPGCSAAMMTRCVRPHAGALWPLALPMIPYMRANLRRKRAGSRRPTPSSRSARRSRPICVRARPSSPAPASRSFRTRWT